MFKDLTKRFALLIEDGSAGTNGNGGQDTGEEKVFTQADVDRIVGERLGREKTKYQDYDELKELVPVLQEFGYEGTATEIKAVLKQQAQELKQKAELEALKDEADKNGTTPELLAKIDKLEKKLSDFEKDKDASQKEAEAKRQAEEDFNNQVEEFQEKYPDVDLNKLGENQKFAKFFQRSNPKLTLLEVYEDFVDMVGGAEAEAIAKLKSNIDRSTSSGRDKGDSTGGSYNLTPHQQQLAKDNGMTNKEYAELLGHIKK